MYNIGNRSFVIFAACLVILGAKLVLIHHYGSNIPFWDQWDSEADFLYRPYFTGELTFSDLIHPHNEHRILLTRLFSLLLLELNGAWLPMLQMVANAGVHVVSIALFLMMISWSLGPTQRVILCATTALFYSLAFGWENTLAGFQSQFYFVFAFSMLAILLTVPASAFSLRWLLGFIAFILAYFSMASGALSGAAIIAIYLLQFATQTRVISLREILGSLVILSTFLIMYRAIPHLELHEPLKAHGLIEFLTAFVATASWPLPSHVILAFLLNLPTLLLFIRLLRKKPSAGNSEWLIMAAMAWVVLQWISFAYGRADGPTASRYRDTLIVGLLVNVAAALHLSSHVARQRIMAFGYCAALAVAVTALSQQALFVEAPGRKASYDTQMSNLADYIRTKDRQKMASLPFFSIPYPNAERLATIVDNPLIRDILHPELTGQGLNDHLLLPKAVTKFFRGIQILLLKSGWLIIAIGMALFIASVILSRRRAPSSALPSMLPR